MLVDARLPLSFYEATNALSGITPATPIALRRDALAALVRIGSSASGPERLADLEDIAAIASSRLGYPPAVIREALGLSNLPESGIQNCGVNAEDVEWAADGHPRSTGGGLPPGGELAGALVELLKITGGPLALVIATQILRASDDSKTAEVLKLLELDPPRPLAGIGYRDAAARVREACERDDRLVTDGAVVDVCGGSTRPAIVQMGRLWTADEESRLRAEWAQGLPIDDIARRHGRTIGAIQARLVRLGLMEVPETAHSHSDVAADGGPGIDGGRRVQLDSAPTPRHAQAPASQTLRERTVDTFRVRRRRRRTGDLSGGTPTRASPLPVAGGHVRRCPHGLDRDICAACNPGRYPAPVKFRYRRRDDR